MIVIASIPGQLCNRLMVHASVMAWCIRHQKKLINPSLAPYDAYFAMHDEHQVVARKSFWNHYRRSFLVAKTSWRLNNPIPGIRCTRIDWHEKINLDDPAVTRQLSRPGVHFLQGWEFRAQQSLTTAKAEVRRYFSLAPALRAQLEGYWDQLGVSSGRTIGVHIRRGDYAHFEGGKYYYENETYLRSMLACAARYRDEPIRFLVCSNEKLDLSYFRAPGLQVSAGPGHEALDLYALSNCDCIIGPPSTYNLWASFLNEVPLFWIRDKNDVFDETHAKAMASF
jgi:hypothetical protein